MNLKKYFNYHRAPGRNFLSVAEFNEKFSLPQVTKEAAEHAENSVRRARKQFGPNEHITVNFTDAKPKVQEVQKVQKVQKVQNLQELDSLLSEEIEEVNEVSEVNEVEEVCDTCDKSKKKCNGHSFEDAVGEMDVGDAQTLNHLIAFKAPQGVQVTTRLMKGKSRYIEKLRAYINGDNSVKVRMMNGAQESVSNLNPNFESLREALNRFPSGPHFIECD